MTTKEPTSLRRKKQKRKTAKATFDAVWCAIAEERATHVSQQAMQADTRTASRVVERMSALRFDSEQRSIGLEVLADPQMPVELTVTDVPYSVGLASAVSACPHCNSPMTIQDFACVACGVPFEPTAAAILREIAFEASYFGWIYRNRYESEIAAKTGRHPVATKHYLLPFPTQELSWLAAVAVAALVGNATYDVAKTLIRSALNSYAPLMEHLKRASARMLSVPRTTGPLDTDDDDVLERFVRYVAEYLSAVSGTDEASFREFNLHFFGKAAELHKTLTGEAVEMPEPGQNIEEVLGNLHPIARSVTLSMHDLWTKLQFLRAWIALHRIKKGGTTDE